MSLSTALGEHNVIVGMHASDKQGVIDRMLDALESSGAIADRAAAREAVLARENAMSTGMKHGIAIPHGKTPSVASLVACLAVSTEPVPFDSLDGKPCRIFVMTLSPPDKTGPHLQFLAEISRLFKSADRRDALLAAKTPAEALRALL